MCGGGVDGGGCGGGDCGGGGVEESEPLVTQLSVLMNITR